jgi:two-component system response regulator YesN
MYRVFLVEDEIVVREGVRNSIPWDKTPFVLCGEAPDGEIALSMIQDLKPDILITDIRMPFMDGLALSRVVKKTFPWIKIIILSGHDEFGYAREAISIGIEEYLLKPVSVEDMLETLKKVAKRIDDEKEELLSIADLKTRIRPADDHVFDPAGLHSFDSDVFLAKLRYTSKKDIDSIVREYSALLEKSEGENPMPAYFLFGEILVSASKIAEAFGGDIKDIIPFSLNNSAIQEIISSPAAFRDHAKSLLTALFEFRDSRMGGRYQSVVVKAREYIDSSFASADLSLYSTAAYVGISPNHLSTVFSRETGENFIEYLTRIRVEKAKQLLRDTAMKIADIAYETGFSDPHYFSSIFKKNTGVSPREFRMNSYGA